MLGGWYYGHRARSGDRELPVYVTGAERMVAGEEIYRRGLEVKPFTYPPFAAVPFIPFSWLPPSWQPPLWFAVNFAVLIGIVVFLQRYAGRATSGTSPPKAWLFWLLTALLGGHHVLSVFANQSHDLLIAGTVALTAAAWSRGMTFRGSLLAGLWSGLGGAFKATPLLFLGLFGLRLRLVAVVATVGAFVLLSLIPDWFWPRQDGASWLVCWFDINLSGLEVGGTANAAGAWHAHSYLNQSLSGTLTRLLTEPVAGGPFVDPHVAFVNLGAGANKAVLIVGQLAVLGLLTLAVLFAARAVRASADKAQAWRTFGLGEVGAFACGMVLLSPQSSKSHFCVWLFPAAFLADRLLRGPRDRLLQVLLIGALLLGCLASKGIVGRTFGNTLLAYGNVTWCTVLLLLATLRSLSTASRRP